MRNVTYPAIVATDTTNETSAPIFAGQLYAASYVASFSENTAAGAVKFQGSNDPIEPNNLTPSNVPVNWADVANTSQTVVAGATVTSGAITMCFKWIRIVFTRTGGAGTMTVNLNAQGF